MADDTSDGASVFFAVVITVLFSCFAGSAALEHAESEYRKLHSVPKELVSPLIGKDHYIDGRVTFSMLGWDTVFFRIVAVAAVYAIIHSVVGRLISSIVHSLWRANAMVYCGEDAIWPPPVLMVIGSAWPIIGVSIPFLIVALMLGKVYRDLWK